MVRVLEFKRKNFVLSEGRLLAAGKPSHLTAAEWLYLYHQIQEELVGAQVTKCANFATQIYRRREKKFSMENAAL